MDTFEHGYALLIAVDDNAVAKWALPDVVKDVNALAGVLTDPNRCAYATTNVTVLSGAAATKQGILDALASLRERLEADASHNATAFVYYSGHGWRDTAAAPAKYFLIPYDADAKNLRSSSLPASDFAAALAALQPKRLFAALDCCHAAGMEAKDILPDDSVERAAMPTAILTAGAGAVGPASGAKGLDSLGVGKGRAVLSSSQGSQLSYIRNDRTMSAFTYHLVEALTGHARPEAGASEVLVSDVMSHVWRRVPETVRSETGEQQDPDYQVSGNFPIARLLGGKGLQPGAAPPEPVADMRARESAAVRITGDHAFIGRDRGHVITVGDISGSQNVAVGVNISQQALPAAELERVFKPLFEALQLVPADRRAQALDAARALQKETASGANADDETIAGLVETLAALAPAAVGAITGLFAGPELSGLAVGATKFVLGKLKRK